MPKHSSAGAKKRQRKSKMLSALRKANPCPAAMKKIGHAISRRDLVDEIGEGGSS